jgi:hypothetical protein
MNYKLSLKIINMKLQELLKLRPNIFNDKNTKLIRHKDTRGIYDFKDIVNNRDKLLEYQREQSKDVFNCEYIISFIGLEHMKSLLFGIFKVNREKTEKRNNNFYYDLTEINDYVDFNERIVIDWGKSGLAWHQWYENEKEVIEMLPSGYIGSFPGLLNFVLDFKELEKVVKNPDSNKDWEVQLSSINGIYMILDSKSGDLYIGSANGQKGVFGRWEGYIKTKHGGNKKLIELIEKEHLYYQNFKFSILQTLPNNITKPEIDKIESIYKEKLGTRVFGLNNN